MPRRRNNGHRCVAYNKFVVLHNQLVDVCEVPLLTVQFIRNGSVSVFESTLNSIVLWISFGMWDSLNVIRQTTEGS